jgi:benzylsuccinate CoA-transferase BbsF subunit
MPANLFEGLRILDFTWVGVGPFATKFFSDHGAEVIKIESALRPDGLRTMHPAIGGKVGINRGGYYANRNSGKLSLGVDLSRPEGLAVVRKLLPASDVVVSNFRPGVMEKFGLSYEAVCALRPDVVYVSMPMFGETGPYREFAGYGLILGAMAGLTGLTRYADGPPQGTGTNFSDHVPNPVHGAISIAAALIHRARTGEGQAIEISQLESSVNFIGPALLQAAVNGINPRPGDTGSSCAPEGVFKCKGDDQWCAISCDSDQSWAALRGVLELPAAATAPALQTEVGRLAAAGTIQAWISECIVAYDKNEVAAALRAAGVCAAAVNNVAETVADGHLNARGHWVRLPAMEDGGDTLYSAPPMHFTGEEATPMARAPRLGEHTRDICIRLLSMAPADIDDNLARGILFET